MTPGDYQRFLDDLLARLEAEPEVLGLVTTGSTAGGGHAPDAWSDHDFWVVVAAGRGEAFRNRLTWLPDPARVAYAFRETPHGLKVIYDDGHLLEYAVFEPAELAVAKVNDYRVLLDRAGIGDALAGVRGQTLRWAAAAYADDRWLMGQVLTHTQIAVGRFYRGERLSSHHYFRSLAIENFVRLVVRHVPPTRPDLRDDIDPRRRFEQVWPELGDRLDALLLMPVPSAARALLRLISEVLRPHLPEFPQRAIRALTEYIQTASPR